MSADNENMPPKGPRLNFNVDEARARARQAMRKSEIIFTRAYGLLREPKKEWEQIKAEETTVPSRDVPENGGQRHAGLGVLRRTDSGIVDAPQSSEIQRPFCAMSICSGLPC